MPAAMPTEEEEDGLPLCQSVVMFCCKGIIEGIIVVLFLWLLIQVLFTKQLEGETCVCVCVEKLNVDSVSE